MSTNPFKSKTFKHLAQDMPLLLDRYFLTVRKGPSRNYKPHLEVASEQETSTLTTQTESRLGYMYDVSQVWHRATKLHFW